MFKLANTFQNPAAPSNAQRGFPAPGAGAQTSGPGTPQPWPTPRTGPQVTQQGVRSWLRPSAPADEQRGFPAPLGAEQRIPAGTRKNPPMFPQENGGVIYVETPYYSRGAAAFAPNFGKVLSNPIGAGIAVSHPFRPFEDGPSAQYFNHALWWTSQVIPTSLHMQGLDNAATFAAILGMENVQAVVPVY